MKTMTRKVFYLSLYLDHGERTAKLKEQINDIPRDVIAVYGDVLYGPGQRALAEDYVQRARRLVVKRLPLLRNIHISATFCESPTDDPRSNHV